MERFCPYCIYVELQLEVGVLWQKGQCVFCWEGREQSLCSVLVLTLLQNDTTRMPFSLAALQAAEERCENGYKVQIKNPSSSLL